MVFTNTGEVMHVSSPSSTGVTWIQRPAIQNWATSYQTTSTSMWPAWQGPGKISVDSLGKLRFTKISKPPILLPPELFEFEG